MLRGYNRNNTNLILAELLRGHDQEAVDLIICEIDRGTLFGIEVGEKIFI